MGLIAYPSTRTKEAILKGLDFFIDNSRETKDGRKYVVYPGFDKGYTGTVALLTLSLIDFLRVEDDPQLIKKYKVELSKYIKFLMSIMTNKKQFYGSYRFKDGTGFGAPSPYYDGETLLALIKAAKYLEFSELKYAITESAEAMYNRNIRDALELDPDSDITKGFYQWSSMAYYELYTTRWDDTEKYAKRVIDLAYWMIDVHQTLRRRKNTAYAHEGLIVAWEIARLNKDRFAMYKIGSVIDEGLYKLTSWQVEGPLENKFLRSHSTDDPVAIGGVMNSKSDSRLRIDVAQHQMHAVILARRYIYTDKDKK